MISSISSHLAAVLARFKPAPPLDESPPAGPRPWDIEPTELPQRPDALEAAVARGHHAERLLEDELLLWALGDMRRRLTVAWESADIRDKDGLQVLRIRAELLKEFCAELRFLVDGGKIAAREIDKLEQERQHRETYGRNPVV